MSRYFTRSARPKACECEDFEDPLDRSGITAHEVYEQDWETFTGILDHRGNEIHRCEQIQMGFERPTRREQ